MKTSLTDMTAALRARIQTSRDLVEKALVQANAIRERHAFITLDAEAALRVAESIDAVGDYSAPLAGVPIVVKDNINSSDMPTTAGTPALRDNRPTLDAPILHRLRSAGVVLIGKTNMHELALGVTSDNAAFGAVGNAYDPTRIAGGSSGGTAVAVATGVVAAGLGSDTGGSVRQPAALNGVFGFRPTIGRYPAAGIVPISHTQDTPGLIAGCVSDLVVLDTVITGDEDPVDTPSLRGMRLGLPAAMNSGVDAAYDEVYRAALAKLEEAGVVLVPLDFSREMERTAEITFPVATWEMKRDLQTYLENSGSDMTVADIAAAIASPDVRSLFNTLVIGDKAQSDAHYGTAMSKARPDLQRRLTQAFEDRDIEAVVFPTTLLAAVPIKGSADHVTVNGQPAPTQPSYSRNNSLAGAAGLPGLSVPVGLTEAGLPVGLEIDGPVMSDRKLLAIGAALASFLGPFPSPPYPDN